jgi:hypothetical protein
LEKMRQQVTLEEVQATVQALKVKSKT